MLSVLSLMDERSRPKGSRDPLGIEAVWSFMGRKLVGNLTTVTSNLDNFMVALLCCSHASATTDQLDLIQINYLRAEQLAAYLRLDAGNESFLGVTRAKVNFKSGQMPLGNAESAQILSNQLSYGLWGLYSTALQVAGLISGPERRLTTQGQELVSQMTGRLAEGQWQTFKALAENEQVTKESLKALSPSFNRMLVDTRLRQVVAQALLSWQGAKQLQLQLYKHSTDYLSQFAGEISVSAFCRWLYEQTEVSDELRNTIAQIQSLEPLLILASTLMEWLQGQKGTDRARLLDIIQPRLDGLEFSNIWQGVDGLPHSVFLTRLLEGGNARSADAVISCTLEQNKLVMQQRGGAAWVEWQNSKLKVRVPNDCSSMPESLSAHCYNGWHNSYFIGSFLNIARQAVQ